MPEVYQHCFTNATEQYGRVVRSGWKPVAVSDNTPPFVREKCRQYQNADAPTTGGTVDESGGTLKLYELLGDSDGASGFVYVIRTKYGLADRAGRMNNIFSHAYVFRWEDVHSDPSLFLRLDEDKFCISKGTEQENTRDAEEKGRPDKLDELIFKNQDGAAWKDRAWDYWNPKSEDARKNVVQCVFVRAVSDREKAPLYLLYDGDDEHLRQTLYCLYTYLPFSVRRNLKVSTWCDLANEPKQLMFVKRDTDTAREIIDHETYVDIDSGENNYLDSSKAKIALRKSGYVTYAAEQLHYAEERDRFYHGLDACVKGLGDPAGENLFLLEIAFRCFWDGKGQKFCEFGKKEIGDTDRFPNGRLNDLLTNVVRSGVVDSEKLDWLTECVFKETTRRSIQLSDELSAALYNGKKRRNEIYNKSVTWDFLPPEPPAEPTPAPTASAVTVPVSAPASVSEPEAPQTAESTDTDPAQNSSSKSAWDRENVEDHADDANGSTSHVPAPANPVTAQAPKPSFMEPVRNVAGTFLEKVNNWLKPKKMVPEEKDISDAVQDLWNAPEAERNEEIRELSNIKDKELSEQNKRRKILKLYFRRMSDYAITHNQWNTLISVADTWKSSVAPYGDTVTNDIWRHLLEAGTALSAQTITPTGGGAIDVLETYRRFLRKLTEDEEYQNTYIEAAKVFYYNNLTNWTIFDFKRGREYREMLPANSQIFQRIYADFADLAAEFNTTSRLEYLRRIHSFFFEKEKEYYLIVDTVKAGQMMELMCEYLVDVYHEDNVTKNYQLWMKLAAYEGDDKLFQQILDLFTLIDRNEYNSVLEIGRQLPKFIQDCRKVENKERSKHLLYTLSIPVMMYCAERDSRKSPVSLDLWLTIGNAYKGPHNIFELFSIFDTEKLPAIFYLPSETVVSRSAMIQYFAVRKQAVEYGNQYRWKGPVEQAIGAWVILYEKDNPDIPGNERVVRGVEHGFKKKFEQELKRRMKATPDVPSRHSQDQPKGASADTPDPKQDGKKEKAGKKQGFHPFGIGRSKREQ